MAQDWLTRNMFLREVETPTQNQGMMSPQFGGSPEQLLGIMQHPQMQALLGQLGVHFDPSKMRQSPFLPNSFMQGHPALGGAMTGAMANAAATPEAPLVSGAGSGISRAMQGMEGGPEMLRQYQVRQMLSPMQAAGATMPMQEFQRKQQLLELLRQQSESSQDIARQEEERKLNADLAKKKQADEHAIATRPFIDAGGRMNTFQEPQGQQPPHPEPGPWGGTVPGGVGPMMAPGAPAQPGGWQRAPSQASPEEILRYQQALHPERQSAADYKQALIDAGVPEAQADYYSQRAFEAQQKGNTQGQKQGGRSPEEWEKEYRVMDEKYSDKIRTLEAYIANPQISQEQKTVYQQQIDQLNQEREQEKAKIDAARGQPGASKPYLPEKRYKDPNAKTPPQVAPGASPGQAQAGGPGAQQNQNVAPAPNPQAVW